MDLVGARLPAGEPRGDPPVSRPRPTTTCRSGRSGSVSRAWLDPETPPPLRRLQLPRASSPTSARSRSTTARVERLVDVKGPVDVHGHVARPTTPAAETIFYTTDNNAYRDLVALDPSTRKTRVLLKDARIGDLAFDRADRSLWGIRHLNGICTLVRIPAPVEGVEAGALLALRPGGLRPRRLARRQPGLGLGRRGDGQHSLRVFRTDALLTGDADARRAQFDFGTAIPVELRLLARRPLPLRQLVLHRRVEHLPLRARDRQARGGQQHRDRLLPAAPAGRTTR